MHVCMYVSHDDVAAANTHSTDVLITTTSLMYSAKMLGLSLSLMLGLSLSLSLSLSLTHRFPASTSTLETHSPLSKTCTTSCIVP